MSICNCDAERLALIDWVANHSQDPTFFVDDARVSTSSPAAIVGALGTINQYAQERGIVYDTGPNTKSNVMYNLAGSTSDDLVAP